MPEPSGLLKFLTVFAAGVAALSGGGRLAHAEPAPAVLNSVFPAGGQRGTSVEVAVEGAGIEGADRLLCGEPRIVAKRLAPGRFQITIPESVRTGSYDVRAVGAFGISSPRTFVVGRLREQAESQPNDNPADAEKVELDSTLNGRIEKAGDVDCYRFEARKGQRVVVDCFADRIDSQLRAVVDVTGPMGTRVMAARESPRLDPVVDFVAPESGEYFARIHDLSFAGGANHFYRLEIDTGSRFEYAIPPVIQAGVATRVAVYGRNLPANPLWIEVTAPAGDPDASGLRLAATQVDADLLTCHLPDGNAPLPLSVTDVAVRGIGREHRTQGNPYPIDAPCEAAGQLIQGDEQAWFELTARSGEVFWLEGFGERIGSPVDLDLVVLDATGENELAHFADAVENPGGYRLPLAHSDPAGRWVAPSDGRFLVMLRNLTGGSRDDPRRAYRLSVRREEPDFHLAVVARRKDQPAALQVGLGGRESLDVIVMRQRGMREAVRVTASGLPDGVECPEIWIGPGANRGTLVFSSSLNAALETAKITVTGTAEIGGRSRSHRAWGGTMIWAGQSLPSGRLTGDVMLATGAVSPVRLTATASQAVVSQEGALDIAVEVERANPRIARPVSLVAANLPPEILSEIATVGPGSKLGWISFQIPPQLAPGDYSLAIVGETQALPVGAAADAQPVAVTAVSNAVSFRVEASRIALGVDANGPVKIGRGKVIQLNFFAERKHGFIGKTHVELVAPGGVTGLRGRGVTLVGQSDSGVIQIIANEDAPLGQQPFLRLEAVGTVEDRPTYRATRPLKLEIVE